jgi:hypothetical protein
MTFLGSYPLSARRLQFFKNCSPYRVVPYLIVAFKASIKSAYNPMMASMLHLSTPLGVLKLGTCRRSV